MSEVKNRSEILFLYDVSFANPNGDPLDENKPRIDEDTGINIVTDVRLKRTVRDYLHQYKGLDVFILEIRDENGVLRTKEDRLGDFNNDPEKLLQKFIDLRLFGATTAVKEKTLALTGPVQFKFGKSLHKVDLTYIKGTTVMPSGQDKKQGTFTEKYILPYSLIAFYGVVNENAAKIQNIPLLNSDIDLLLEAMWYGTKNLLSTSKIGQMPRLLIQVIYDEPNYHIGDLDRKIRFIASKNDIEIRDIQEGVIEIDDLINTLDENINKIQKIRYKYDKRVLFTQRGEPITINDALKKFALEELIF